MVLSTLSAYQDVSLQELITKINREYYEFICQLATRTSEHSSYLKLMLLEESQYAYISFGDQLIDAVNKYLSHRKNILLPYIQELSGKAATGHNCSTCSGRCEVQHGAKLIDFVVSLQDAKSVIQQLQVSMAKHPSEDNELRILTSEIALLGNLLKELFVIEEDILLAKMKNAQKSINATS